MNLVEVPVIFYALIAFNLALGLVDPVVLSLAWVYVGLRLTHSLIYLTYNHVVQRFAVFAISNLVRPGDDLQVGILVALTRHNAMMRAPPNPSLNLRANGMPQSPRHSAGVHYLWRGLCATPLTPG